MTFVASASARHVLEPLTTIRAASPAVYAVTAALTIKALCQVLEYVILIITHPNIYYRTTINM